MMPQQNCISIAEAFKSMYQAHDTLRLNEIDIISVANMLGLQVKGRKTHCFIHSEKTPSLTFYQENNRWYCFGCRANGDVIELVMQKEQLKFNDACIWLEHRFFGITTHASSYQARNPRKIYRTKMDVPKLEMQSEPDHELYDEVINHLVLSNRAVSYLCETRALSPDVVRSHHIVSFDDVDSIHYWLNKNYTQDRLLSAGLKKSYKESTFFMWRKPGIIFPYFDINKTLVNLQFRPYETEQGGKYVFLDGVKTCMYNECRLSDLPRGANVFLCEGAIDTISMITAGYDAVGLPGVATLNGERVDILSRFNINIIYDSDESGQKNAAKHKAIFQARNINVQLFSVEPYDDVNERLVKERVK